MSSIKCYHLALVWPVLTTPIYNIFISIFQPLCLSFIVSFTWHYKFRLAIHFHPNIGYLPAKIKICYHSSAEESAKNQDTIPLFRRRVSKKSRYTSTLPQKSQHKIKIRYHSSAEESAKNKDMIPLFRRRVSKKSRYASTLPQKSQQKIKICFHSSAEESVFQSGG